MSRKNLFYKHAAITLIVTAGLFCVIRFKWYPSFYYSIREVSSLFIPLAITLIIIGPLFTFFAYKENRHSMARDLAVIVILQLSALSIGIHKIYTERPLFMVFSVDRFVIVTANSVDQNTISPLVLLDMPGGEMPMLVAAHLPKDSDLSFMLEVLNGAPDIEFRPELYEPVVYQRKQIQAKGYKTGAIRAKFQKLKDEQIMIEKNLDRSNLLGYPLVNSSAEDKIILIDVDKLKPVKVIDVSPWALLKGS